MSRKLPGKPPTRAPAPITSQKIKHLAGEGMRAPSKLTTEQVRELAASVAAHIEPRGGPKKSGR